MTIDILVPSLGESVSEGTVSKWLKKEGDNILQDEAICELETDKIAIEICAEAAGTLSKILVEEGDNINVGGKLGELLENVDSSINGDDSKNINFTPKPKEPLQKEDLDEDSNELLSKNDTFEQLSPAVRKLVVENKVSLSTIIGSGKSGRITKGDILQSINSKTTPKSESNYEHLESEIEAEPVERVKISRLRQRVAEGLKAAQNSAAILSTFNEVDMTNVIAARKKYQDEFQARYGVRLGFMSFFVQASINALKELPAINAEIINDEIAYKKYWHIGVAVSAPQGLVVPVLKHADRMGFAEIEMKISDLGERASNGKLAISDITGGTFTISNGGIFGSMLSTPILNYPQSGILGMHKIQNRPVAIGNEIKIRPMMYLALSYDHRIIDGREAVTFLVRIRDFIENPERILLGI